MSRSVQEIEDWIVARVSGLTGVAAQDIDAHAPIARSGLDSVGTVALAAELETWLDYRFRANPLDEHRTIAGLARFLAEQIASRERQA